MGLVGDFRMLDRRWFRRSAAAVLLGAAVLLSGTTPAVSQDPPPTPKKRSSDPKQEEREKKAQALLDLAGALEKDNKLAEAQAKLRELRYRFRSTWTYLDRKS